MFGDIPLFPWLVSVVLFAIGLWLGVLLSKRKQVKSKPVLKPEQWPLLSRSVTRPNEAIIWRWLRANFPDHLVLLKLPFSRFTAPEGKAGRECFDMLNSLYATYTITDRDGNVFGCIDLEGMQTISTASQQYKETTLARLNIAYAVLQPSRLPQPAVLRASMLRARQQMSVSESTFEELDDARAHLQELLGRQRVRRPDAGDFRPSDLGRLTDSVVPSSWQSL